MALNLEFDAKSAEITAQSYNMFTVAATDCDTQEVLNGITAAEIVEYKNASNLLDEIISQHSKEELIRKLDIEDIIAHYGHDEIMQKIGRDDVAEWLTDFDTE